MKYILFPTDFSRNAWKALDYTRELLKAEECTFYLLNAFQVSYFTTDSIIVPEAGDPAFEMAKAESETNLDKLLEQINSKGDKNKHHFKTISSFNSVAEAVKINLKNHHFDLVAMGTKGENNAANQLYGSNAITIMEAESSAPVLVIPEKIIAPGNGKKEIVFATNFKTSFIREEIRVLADFSRQLSAAIRILYIQESENLSSTQKENKEILQEYLGDVAHSFHTLTNIKVPVGIHSFIESRGSQMLVILKRKRGFFSGIFTKSVVEEIGSKPQVPILVLHDFRKK